MNNKSTMSEDAKVMRTIELLLKNSGHEHWNIVSVVAEANKYCYKLCAGGIDVVDKQFIDDRVAAGIY